MRRHLIGLCLGVVMLVEMFFGGAWGYLRLLRLPVAAGAPASVLPAQGGSLLSSTSVITAMGAVGATGLIAGILIAWPRISPLAAGIPGLVALAWTGLYLADVKEAANLIPLRAHAFGAGWEALLFNGILGLAGLAMIVPMCVPGRWRNPYAQDDEAFEADVTDARGFVADLKETVGAESVNQARSADLVGATAATGVLTGRPLPPSGPRLTGGQQRLTGEQRLLTGEHQRLTGGQQRLTGGQMRVTGSQTRLTGGQPPVPGGQQRWPTGEQARVTGSQRAMPDENPMLTGEELMAQLQLPDRRRLFGSQRRRSGEQ